MVLSKAALAGAVALVLSTAAYGTETFPETLRGGQDKAAYHAAQIDLHKRLTSVGLKPAKPILVEVTRQDRIDMGEIASSESGPQAKERRMLVGVTKPLGQDVDFASTDASRGGSFFGGIAQAMNGGGFVWQERIESPGATGLRIKFENLNLPSNAALYVYNDAGEAHGPYRSDAETGEVWSNTVFGDHATIQLRVDGAVAPAERHLLRFRVAEVGHLGQQYETAKYLGSSNDKAFCSFNASCVVNASCTSDWANEGTASNGVAHIQFVSGAYIYICSGGLLNDTVAATQEPYFLTANHCISRRGEASSMEAFWQFTTTCGGDCFDPDGRVPSTLGATILAGSKTSDFTFMKLSQTPPAGSVFLGVNSTAVANSNGTDLFRLSHPKGAPQAYSRHDVDTTKGVCRSWPRGNWIYSKDAIGATEGGSSGSVVMNTNAQVVGQLSGGCGTNINEDCDAESNATVDGALAAYWSKVRQWLQPQ